MYNISINIDLENNCIVATVNNDLNTIYIDDDISETITSCDDVMQLYNNILHTIDDFTK